MSNNVRKPQDRIYFSAYTSALRPRQGDLGGDRRIGPRDSRYTLLNAQRCPTTSSLLFEEEQPSRM